MVSGDGVIVKATIPDSPFFSWNFVESDPDMLQVNRNDLDGPVLLLLLLLLLHALVSLIDACFDRRFA
jgi:hypothetical protein